MLFFKLAVLLPIGVIAWGTAVLFTSAVLSSIISTRNKRKNKK